MGSSTSKTAAEQNSTNSKSRLRKKEADLSKLPARVDNVKVDGLQRTHEDYVRKVADDLFQTNNFQQLLLECSNARSYLYDLGIFKDIAISIDVSKGEKATQNGYQITFKGKEFARVIGSVGTEIGQNEGALTTELASPNLFGRGERLTLQGAYSNFKTSEISLKLSKSFLHTIMKRNKPEISISLFRHANAVPISAFRNSNLGILYDISFITNWPLQLAHSLQYEASIREITLLNKSAPFFVRENCGPRMASLVRYLLAYDNRNDGVFPSNGIYIKTTNEFNGLGGDIGYIMNNTHAELNLPLFNNYCSLQLCSRFGILKIDNKSPPIPINSLFFFGGPLSLRGFQYGGAGPQEYGYTAGVNAYWSIGCHFWSPLPYSSNLGRLSNNFRSHLFYNVGGYNTFTMDGLKSAAGLGIAYKFADRARIEINYCFPLQLSKSDRICSGFQFGIGYEFI